MSNLLSTMRIPEYAQTTYPLFVEFLKIYYEYASKRGNPDGEIANYTSATDVDTALDEDIARFYSVYSKDLPLEIALDKRNFIKLLNSIYIAKGTEKAYKLLFRALFNEEIVIETPFDRVLKASDGNWVRDSFITVKTLYGEITSSNNILEFSNSTGIYAVESKRYEVPSAESYRFYFNASSEINIDDDQEIFVSDTNGDIIFVGELVSSPSNLIIQSPGANWLVGQVVIIPGSIKDTIARVTKVNSTGGIEKLEILEYGYVHPQNQITTTSPYPNRPAGSSTTTTSTLISIDPIAYDHQINVIDYTDNITESIIGLSDTISASSYFLQDYTTRDYTGNVVIEQQSVNSASGATQVNTEITIEEWLASRTTLVYDRALIVKTKGNYTNEAGQLSNQTIRLHDSYYYQIFSYVIESTKNNTEYKDALSSIHPAGLKLFSKLSKISVLDVIASSSRTKSYDTVYLLDLASQTDEMNNNLTKALSSLTSPMTDNAKLTSIKYLTDTVVASASETVTSNIDAAAYASEDYFLEQYTSKYLQLSIG